MGRDPVPRDLFPGGHPHLGLRRHIVEEARQGGGAAGSSGKPAVQADRHHLRRPRALGIEHVETVLHRLQPAVARTEARRHGELHVVHFERIGNDEVRRPSSLTPDLDPIGKVVGVGIARIEKAAMLDHGFERVQAEAAGVPADRRAAGRLLDRLHGLPHMVELLLEREVLVVDPAPAMARDLMAGFGHRLAGGGIEFERAADRPGGEAHVAFLEEPQDAPEAGAAAILVHRLGREVAAALDRRAARRLGQEDLGGGIAVQDRILPALLVIQHEADRDPGIARPLRMRRVGAVADQVAVEMVVHAVLGNAGD